MLKDLYIAINMNMRSIIIGFIAAVFVAAALLPPEIIENNLLLAWGGVAVFSLFLALGDHVLGWWNDVAGLFD